MSTLVIPWSVSYLIRLASAMCWQCVQPRIFCRCPNGGAR